MRPLGLATRGKYGHCCTLCQPHPPGVIFFEASVGPWQAAGFTGGFVFTQKWIDLLSAPFCVYRYAVLFSWVSFQRGGCFTQKPLNESKTGFIGDTQGRGNSQHFRGLLVPFPPIRSAAMCEHIRVYLI